MFAFVRSPSCTQLEAIALIALFARACQAHGRQIESIVMDSPFVPVWVIVGRHTHHDGRRHNISTWHREQGRRQVAHLWTQEMKRLYVSSFWRQEGLDEETSAEDFQRAHQQFDHQCIGLCLMRATCNPSLTTYLSPAQRSIDDYYQETIWAREPAMLVDVVAFAPAERGLQFVASDIDQRANFMFFKPTISSARRGLDSPLHGQSGLHGTVRDELARWVAMRQANREQVRSVDVNGLPRLAMIVPAAHALLLTAGKLTVYAFPWPRDRRRRASLGMQYANDLLIGEEPANNHAPSQPGPDQIHSLEPMHCQEVADTMRLLLQEPDQIHRDDLLRRASACIDLMQGVRNRQAQIVHENYRKHFDLTYLVECVAIGGFLNNNDSLRQTLEMSLRVLCREPAMFQSLQAMLSMPRSTPHPKTLLVRRLPVAVAVAFSERPGIYAALHGTGVVSYGTADCSPQAGYNFLSAGFTTISIDKLIPCYEASLHLCRSDRPGLGEGAEETDAIKELMSLLKEHLQYKQSLPVALGSGFAGIPQHVRALCHTRRFTCQSWQDVVLLMNSVFIWVGDLGESKISDFHGDLRYLFGPWIADPCAQSQQEPDQPDGFAFEEEAELVGHAPEEAVLGDAFAFEEEAVVGDAQLDVPSGDAQSEHAFSFQDEAVLGELEPEIAFSFEDEIESIVEPGSSVPNEGVAQPGVASPVHPGNGVPDAGDAQPEVDPSINPWLLDFRGSLYISGMLHIVSNLTKDIHGALLHWATFLDELRHVCRLLNHKWSKQRFMKHLLNDAPWSYFMQDIEKFQGGVYEGRWGSVMEAVENLLPLKDVVRGAWNKQRFLAGRGVEEERQDGSAKSVRVDIADAAIISTMFWAYLVMVDFLAEALMALTHWSERCPCCSRNERNCYCSTRARREAWFRTLYQIVRCPMAGRRGPEMARGEWRQVIRGLLGIANANLRMHPALQVLSERDKAIILADFARARRHILITLTFKLSPWTQLPYMLIGLGHHDDEKARWCGERALQLYPHAPTTVREHAWVSLLCSAGGALNSALMAFVWEGRRLADVPALHIACAIFRFVPVVERWVESLHAQIKKHFQQARNAGMRHLAFKQTHAALLDAISTPDRTSRFVDTFAECRHIVLCLKGMGLMQHPTVAKILGRGHGYLKPLHKKYYSEVVKVLFHTHIDSMFAPFHLKYNSESGGGSGGGHHSLRRWILQGDAPSQQEPDREDSHREDEDAVAELFGDFDEPEEGEGPSQQEPGPDPDACDGMSLLQCVGADPSPVYLEGGGALYDELCAKAAYEYMLLYADQERAAGQFCFFSAGPLANGRRGVPLTTCLNIHPPKPTGTGSNPGEGVDFDFVEEPEPTGTGSNPCEEPESYSIDMTDGEMLVYSLDKVNAGAVSNVPLAPQLIERASCVAFVYSVVELRRLEGNKGRFRVALEGSSGTSPEENNLVVFSYSSFTLQEYSTIRAWRRSDRLHYDFGLAYETPLTDAKELVLLAKLLDLSGVGRPGFLCAGSEQETDQTLDALLVWQRHGLVSSTVHDNGSIWCLTERGRQRLRLTWRLQRVKHIMRDVDEGVPVKDRCAYQLVLTLRAAGWEHRQKEPRDGAELNPYVVGGPKIWWLFPRQKCLHAWYFISLLLAHVHKRQVPHGRPVWYYKAIAEGDDPDRVAQHRATKRQVKSKMVFVEEGVAPSQHDEYEPGDAIDDDESMSLDANDKSDASSSSSSSSSSSPKSTASAPQPLKKRRVDSVPEPPAGPRRAANELDYVIFQYQRIQKITFKGTNELKSLTAFCKCHANCTRTRSLQKFGGLDKVRIMMKQWLLAPHFGFASDDSRQLGTKSSHMDLPDVVWFPFDEAELDDQAVDVEDLDNPILNED